MTAATLVQWREAFLAGGHTALKCRLTDERDDEIQRLRAKVAEITMNNELLLKVQPAGGDRAFTATEAEEQPRTASTTRRPCG